MLVWMAVARRRAFAKMGISWGTIPRGSRGVDLDGRAPDEAQWPSHNYNHLMEQPTIFYAIALTLAMMSFGGGINYWLAWGYVGLRVVHSIVQATVNVVRIPLPDLRPGDPVPDRPDGPRRLPDPSRLRASSAEAGGKLDMGRPAELADRPDPIERDSRRPPASSRRAQKSPDCS